MSEKPEDQKEEEIDWLQLWADLMKIPELPKTKQDMQLGDWIEHYIALRDAKEALKKEHTRQLGPFNDRMSKLETVFQKVMTDNNLENLKTEAGTAYMSEQDSVTVDDWNLFIAWVIDNEAYHFLEKRAQKSSVHEMLEGEGTLPPGVSRKSSIKVNVRRS